MDLCRSWFRHSWFAATSWFLKLRECKWREFLLCFDWIMYSNYFILLANCLDVKIISTRRLSTLEFLPTGLFVVILWFSLCLAISLLAGGKSKEGHEPTPIVSPILMTTLVFGLAAQIHPSVYATLSVVVDSIPEIATAGCVLSAGYMPAHNSKANSFAACC